MQTAEKTTTTTEKRGRSEKHIKTAGRGAAIPVKFIKQRVSVNSSLFAFLAKGNSHCPS